jgi:protein TIF31
MAKRRWNPAPASRRLQGDLFYVEVTTLENAVLNITATASGFFLNRTHRDTFNPLPVQPLVHAYSLVSLLSLASASFKKNYVQV